MAGLQVLIYFVDCHRHLICVPYSVERLHEMATDLGIKRCWFHPGKYPHYDVPKKRMDEIKARCRLISSQEILEIIKRWKNLPSPPRTKT